MRIQRLPPRKGAAHVPKVVALTLIELLAPFSLSVHAWYVAPVRVARQGEWLISPLKLDPFGFRPRNSGLMQRSRARFATLAPSEQKDEVEKTHQKKKLTQEAGELDAALQERRTKNSKYDFVIAQVAPSVRVSFSEEFGHEPGAFPPGLLVSALKELGFDLVFDTNTAADLTICEEGTELLKRIMLRNERQQSIASSPQQKTLGDLDEDEVEPMPLFTSCCPGWMNYVEKCAPELVPYISTCKSPHMMLGAVVKRYSSDLLDCPPSRIYFCSVMPCVRKRCESDHEAFMHNGVRDVDNVITTRDLGELLRRRGVDPEALRPATFDSIFQRGDKVDGTGSGAGQLFGATGGVMEAAVRSVYELVRKEHLPRIELEEVRGFDAVKEATIPLLNEETGQGLPIDLKVAVVNGLGNAKKLIAKMKKGDAHYDFVEVMACPGGCIGGGGQPKSDGETMEKRLECIYSLDRSLPVRRSHENPAIRALYDRHLGEFGGDTAREVLHVKQIYDNWDEEEDKCEEQECEL